MHVIIIINNLEFEKIINTDKKIKVINKKLPFISINYTFTQVSHSLKCKIKKFLHVEVVAYIFI